MKNFTCDILCENFPFAFLPFNPKTVSNVLLYLNPLSSPQLSDNFNQIVNIETYQRLVRQDEMNAMNSGGSTSTNTNDYFQPYYNNLGVTEQTELNVRKAQDWLDLRLVRSFSKTLIFCFLLGFVPLVERDAGKTGCERRML